MKSGDQGLDAALAALNVAIESGEAPLQDAHGVVRQVELMNRDNDIDHMYGISFADESGTLFERAMKKPGFDSEIFAMKVLISKYLGYVCDAVTKGDELGEGRDSFVMPRAEPRSSESLIVYPHAATVRALNSSTSGITNMPTYPFEVQYSSRMEYSNATIGDVSLGVERLFVRFSVTGWYDIQTHQLKMSVSAQALPSVYNTFQQQQLRLWQNCIPAFADEWNAFLKDLCSGLLARSGEAWHYLAGKIRSGTLT